MYLTCPACNKRLQIPDNKLPTDHAVRITCPACQQRFPYDPRAHHRNTVGTLADTGLAAQIGMVTMPPRTMMADTSAMQALVCLDSPEHQEVCQQMLQSLGYTADLMPNQFKALEYLREVPY